MKNYLFLNKTQLDWDNYVKFVNTISIDALHINEELINAAGFISYYMGLLAELEKELADSNKNLDKLESHLRLEFDKVYREANKSKPNDTMSSSVVNNNDDFNNSKADIITIQYKIGLVKGIIRSLEHRKDYLIQLSSNTRAEMRLHD